MDDHTEAERAKNEHIARHHGEYWLDNRSAILDAIEQAGFVLMSNATGFWLAARATLASAPAAGEKPSPVDATASLIEAARAVVARWHAPVWKEVEHTAAFIARLDEAATTAALRKLTTAGQAQENYEGPVIDCRTCVHIGALKDCTAPVACVGGTGFERRSALQLWRCTRCGAEMRPGIATEETLTGLPDFPGDRRPVTLSPGGPGVLIDCIKCSACGHSVSR